MTRRIFLASLAAPAFAASWDQPAFPDWTQDFVDRLLTDSPWARPLTVSFNLTAEQQRPQRSNFQIQIPGIGLPRGVPRIPWPGGGRTPAPRIPGRGGGNKGGGNNKGARTEVYLTVRWRSALPIRQALALEEYGREGLEKPGAQELLRRDGPGHVIEISGLPTSMVTEGASRLESELSKSARLAPRGRRAATPESVAVPEHGMHLMATLRFPLLDDLGEDDGQVQFSAASGPMKIDLPFKLKTMVYRGRLEL